MCGQSEQQRRQQSEPTDRTCTAWQTPSMEYNGHPCRTADVQDSVPSTCPVPLVPIVPHFRGRSIRSGQRAAGEFCTFFGGVIHRTPTSEARISDSGASFFGHPAGKCPELAVDPSRGSGLQSCRMAANWTAAKKKERRFRQESRSVTGKGLPVCSRVFANHGTCQLVTIALSRCWSPVSGK